MSGASDTSKTLVHLESVVDASSDSSGRSLIPMPAVIPSYQGAVSADSEVYGPDRRSLAPVREDGESKSRFTERVNAFLVEYQNGIDWYRHL